MTLFLIGMCENAGLSPKIVLSLLLPIMCLPLAGVPCNAAEVTIRLADQKSGKTVSSAVVSAQIKNGFVVDGNKVADGTYKLDLPSGTFSVRVKAQGYKLQDFQVASDGANGNHTVSLVPVEEEQPTAKTAAGSGTSGNVVTNLLMPLWPNPGWLRPLKQKCATEPQSLFCLVLGELYSEGTVIHASAKESQAYLQQSCDLMMAFACQKLGRQLPFPIPPGYSSPDTLINNIEAVRNVADCEVSGTPTSCLIGAIAYDSGLGVPNDSSHASKLFNSACSAGLGVACQEIQCAQKQFQSCEAAGNSYATGNHVFNSKVRAATLLKEACDAGLQSACASLQKLVAKPSLGPVAREVQEQKRACRSLIEHDDLMIDRVNEWLRESVGRKATTFQRGRTVATLANRCNT